MPSATGCREAGDAGALVLGDRYLGLEAGLRGVDLVHAAEIGVPFSHGPSLLKTKLGFGLVLTVWETIPFGDAYLALPGPPAATGRRFPRSTCFLQPPTAHGARSCSKEPETT